LDHQLRKLFKSVNFTLPRLHQNLTSLTPVTGVEVSNAGIHFHVKGELVGGYSDSIRKILVNDLSEPVGPGRPVERRREMR